MENSNGRTTYTIIYKLINLKDYKEFPSHNYVPIYLAYSDIDTDVRICYFFMLSKKFSSLSSFTIICKPLHFLINLLKKYEFRTKDNVQTAMSTIFLRCGAEIILLLKFATLL